MKNRATRRSNTVRAQLRRNTVKTISTLRQKCTFSQPGDCAQLCDMDCCMTLNRQEERARISADEMLREVA